MASVAERRRQREQLLLATLQLSGGDPLNGPMPEDVAPEVDASEEELDQAIQWAVGEGLIERMSMGGDFVLTPDGLREAERLQEASEQRMGAALAVITPTQREQVEALITELQRALDTGAVRLGKEDEADARVQIDTIATQLRSPQPRAGVIGVALRALQWIGSEALGGIIGGGAFAAAVALTRLV